MENIKLNTRFGELCIDASKIITFPDGIPGFEDCTQWTLFYELDDQGRPVNSAIIHMQSIDDENVSLPLTEPNQFGFNYELILSDSEVDALKLENPEDILVLTTLSINHAASPEAGAAQASNLFANIASPILINTKSRIGLQKTLVGQDSRVDFKPVVIR